MGRFKYYQADKVLQWLLIKQDYFNNLWVEVAENRYRYPKFLVERLSILAIDISKDLHMPVEEVNKHLKTLFIIGCIQQRRLQMGSTHIRINKRPKYPFVDDKRDLDQLSALIPFDNQWHNYTELPDTVLTRFETLDNLVYSAKHYKNYYDIV